MPYPTTFLAIQSPAGRALRIASRVRALAACAAVTASMAWPATTLAQLVTLLPTDGSSLEAFAVGPGISNVSRSGGLQTPRSFASATASFNGILANGGAYTIWSFVNAIQTVTEDSSSRFAMSFYSGSTYSASALSIPAGEAMSNVRWQQNLSLATESIVVLTHVSTPRFAGEISPHASFIFTSPFNSSFSPVALSGLNGVATSLTFAAPPGFYILGSYIARTGRTSDMVNASLATDTFQTLTVTPIPEPASWALMLGGAVALLVRRTRIAAYRGRTHATP